MGASNFAMLGLGDIVIPGIFIALLLRYDNSLKRGSNFYFLATFIGEGPLSPLSPSPPQPTSPASC